MREFFKGWKRKAGCATLVMACVLMSAWVRGASYRDHLAVTLGDTRHHLIFRNGAVRWEPITLQGGASVVLGTEWESRKQRGRSVAPENEEGTVWYYKFGGFFVGTDGNHPIRIIPYLPVVTSLALLSAYLLFSKPRPAKQR